MCLGTKLDEVCRTWKEASLVASPPAGTQGGRPCPVATCSNDMLLRRLLREACSRLPMRDGRNG